MAMNFIHRFPWPRFSQIKEKGIRVPEICEICGSIAGVIAADISHAVWNAVGWITLGIGLCGILFVALAIVEEKLNRRRLRKMQRETDEKRQRDSSTAHSEYFVLSDRRRGTRAKFLP